MDTVSLLRSFPFVLDHKQQIAFSTLSNLFEAAWVQRRLQMDFMRNHSGKHEAELPVSQRSEMITSLWATVSTLYFIDKICRSEVEMLKKVYLASNLPSFAKDAAELRNAKDHIGQRIGNIAKKRKHLPINGFVRWTFNPHYEGDDFVYNIQFFAIDLVFKSFRFDAVKGIDRRFSAYDHLALFAFSSCLQVSRAFEALDQFTGRLGEELRLGISKSDSSGAVARAELADIDKHPICGIITARGSRDQRPTLHTTG